MLSKFHHAIKLSAAAWVLLCALVGCSGEPRLIEVRGSVIYAGAPLKTGIVSLRAMDQNVTLHQPTGMIDEQGKYRIYTNYQPGAPPGKYRVVVFATEPTVDTGKVSPGMPKSLIPKRYNDVSTTPLELEVGSEFVAAGYDLKLEAEMP